jgi:MFS family permease
LALRFLALVGALLLATVSLLAADTLLLLTLAGVFVGVTVAPTLINGNSLIGRLVPAGRLTEGLSWMGTGIGIGAALGSSVAGRAIDTGGYHSGFVVVVVCAGLAALIALVSYRALARSAQPTDEIVDAAA